MKKVVKKTVNTLSTIGGLLVIGAVVNGAVKRLGR